MATRRRRQWGKGSVEKTDNGNWQVRWREGGRRRTRGGLGSREDAERVLSKILGDMAQGRTGLPADTRSAPKLSEFSEGFLARRKLTHRAGAEDGYRWKKHIAPHFGSLRPGDVDAGRIRAFIEAKLVEGVNPATIRIFVAILSALYTDLLERGIVASNPTRSLPRSTMRLMRPTHDPRTTPFIEKLDDVRRIYLTLPEPLDVAYAIGALAGLRTGEVFALRWEHVDLARRRIHVRESVKGPLKDKESRIVPILDRLLPVLAGWKKRSEGAGRIIQPLRRDGLKIDKHTPGVYLAEALVKLELARPGLRWYQATRHTFASQWVLAGGSIEKLKEILGHYSVVMTERYAHLRPDLFSARDLAIIDLDLNAGEPDPDPSGPENGHETASEGRSPRRIQLKLRRKCRSRPVSRVRNTVGMGRCTTRLGVTSGRNSSRRRDCRRQVVSLPRHRTADYVRWVCLTVNCDMARRPVHLQDQNLGAGRELCCRGLSSRALQSVATRHFGNPRGALTAVGR
ncbi:MAG: site-specific integrase [Anaeromyxobacteraceae bacterium]